MNLPDRDPRRARLDEWRDRAELARAVVAPWRYVLLFSHMRSYSTLLGHLLGSHPQIAGYAEAHHGYRTPADLVDLRYQVWKINEHRVRGRYVFDKILHGRYLIDDEVLHRREVLPIYGIREPFGAVRSVVAMGRRQQRATWQQDPRKAAEHILNRYGHVAELAARRPTGAAMFMDSLVSDPERTLAELGRHLGLRRPLTRTYRTFGKTGVGGFGDPMGPIAAGDIVADRPAHDVEIPDDVAAELLAAYAAVTDALRDCATRIGTPAPPSRDGGAR